MINDNTYDVIVVGGGPGGSTAAYYSALNGAKVVLFERHPDIGNVVRCAEGVSKHGFEELFDPSEIDGINPINTLRIYAPSGEYVSFNTTEIGYILNRKTFDYNLAKKAAEAGARIITRANVVDLIREDGKIIGVKVLHFGEEHTVFGKIVIGADGVESRIGKLAGLRHSFKLTEIDSCAQATIYNERIDKEICCAYFGSEIAPGGYAWCFPKGDNLANVGLGISGIHSKKRPAIEYLNSLLKNYFPDSSILTIIAGGVPSSNALKKIATDNIMLVGDAAHQTNPLTGGGLINAIKAGKAAGEIAAQAIQKNDCSEKILRQYQLEWKKGPGSKHPALFRLKNAVFSISDDALNKIASSLNKIPLEKRSFASIFKIALKQKPGLLLDALKIFTRTT